MATSFTLTLDTTAPQSPTLAINAGAASTVSQVVTANIATADSSTTGYQIKLWGDVDPAANINIGLTEGSSSWIPYSAAKTVTLSTGFASKTLSLKIRDDVGNESSPVSDSISFDRVPLDPLDGISVSGGSALAGAGTLRFTEAVGLSAQSALDAVGTLRFTGTAGLSAQSALGAVGTRQFAALAALSAQSALAAVGKLRFTFAGAFSAQSAFSVVAPALAFQANSAMLGQGGVLWSVGSLYAVGSSAVAGQGSVLLESPRGVLEGRSRIVARYPVVFSDASTSLQNSGTLAVATSNENTITFVAGLANPVTVGVSEGGK